MFRGVFYIVNIDCTINVMSYGRYLTAREAAEALRVTRATLYAYASRGQLRSEPVPGLPRERRYYREDIERLRDRKESRRDPSKAAARALHWGSPVLASGITVIQDGRLYYRGQDALKLAQNASLEEAAATLWAAEAHESQRLFTQRCVLSHSELTKLRRCAPDPVVLFQAALPIAGTVDAASYDLRPAAVRYAGARILRLLTAAVVGRDSNLPVHEALRNAWAAEDTAAEAIRRALVLCADHELNVSTFAARCAASAAASPYDAVSAALATLKGIRHGGLSERVCRLFEEIERPERARAVVAERLRRGESVPGFGHRLYPAGDPRATLLLRVAEASGNEKEWKMVRALSRAGSELLQEAPNLDFGLTAVARTYGLPRNAPFILFALGRTVGWIAHAIEHYSSGDLIRPRAHYTGLAPQSFKST